MALVKCKECGEKVSTKAKVCIKCGAKVPKKTSIFTWLVLIIIILLVYKFNQITSTNKRVEAYNSIEKLPPPQVTKVTKAKKVEPPKPSWSTSNSKDEMTGMLSAYASSPRAKPNNTMSFPYKNVNAWIAVGCNAVDKWAYIGFNSSPNLADTQTEDGYNLIKTRIKWDGNIEDINLTQKWGAKFLHFQNDSLIISKLTSSNSALLELQWHGQQPVYFKFTLNGSSKAMSTINKKCSA